MKAPRLFLLFFLSLAFLLTAAWAAQDAGLKGAGLAAALGLSVLLLAALLTAAVRSLALMESTRLARALNSGQLGGLEEEEFPGSAPLLRALAELPAAPAPARPLPPPLAARPAAAAPSEEEDGRAIARDEERARLRHGLSQLIERLNVDMESLKKLNLLVANLGENIQAVAQQSGDAASKNESLLRNAQRDGELVASEIQTLMGIKEALEQGTAVIDDLASSSREVGPIIESIFVIARKTNMLALNAAIEAARAGEQGKGFAVVAEEVRKLAEAATVSTQKVERFIESLREKTKSAMDVLKGASRIEETIPVVYRISDAFINMVPSVDAAQRSLAELGALVKENIEEVQRVSELVAESNAATEQSLERSRELLDGMGAA